MMSHEHDADIRVLRRRVADLEARLATVERRIEGLRSGAREEIQARGRCPECGGALHVDHSSLLLSKPPKHRTECKACGRVEYVTAPNGAETGTHAAPDAEGGAG